MTSLHATSFRLSLVAISLFVIVVPVLQDPSQDLSNFIQLLMFYCPGIFFALGVVASYRTSSVSFLPTRMLLFVLATVVASLGIIFFAIYLTGRTSMGPVIAGALGAGLLIALMRVFLAYHPRNRFGWLVPMAAGALSQFIAHWILQLSDLDSMWLADIPWVHALLWWWFVGEALLWQQRTVAYASNEPLGRSRGAAS